MSKSSEYKPSSKAYTSAEIASMVDGSDFDQIKWVTKAYANSLKKEQ
jgi:hypothetical protein